jgi:predicted dehydrogenase
MIKAGIIGLGKMGISHCSIVNAHALAKVVAVCDTSSFVLEAFNKYTDMETFTDHEKMIDKAGLDCVFVATPTRFHTDIVKYALSAGVHTFCEKPFVLNVEDGVRLVELAKQKQLVNQVGYHNRFIATFNECKRLIDQKIIGNVFHFVAEAYGPVVVRPKSGTWRSQSAEGGGCLYDYASHVLDLVNFISGAPVRARGTLLKSIYSKSVEDAVYSILMLENGLSGQLSVNWSDESYRKISLQYTALGTKGKITADAQELKIYLKEKNEAASLEKGWNSKYITDFQKPVDFYLRGEEYSEQVDYFIRHVHEKNMENCNSFRNALTTDRVIELLKKDAANNG